MFSSPYKSDLDNKNGYPEAFKCKVNSFKSLSIWKLQNNKRFLPLYWLKSEAGSTYTA